MRSLLALAHVAIVPLAYALSGAHAYTRGIGARYDETVHDSLLLTVRVTELGGGVGGDGDEEGDGGDGGEGGERTDNVHLTFESVLEQYPILRCDSCLACHNLHSPVEC